MKWRGPAFLLLAFAPALPAETIPGRYIVELSSEPVADHVAHLPARARLQSAAALAHRARLRGEQQEARGRLEQRRAQVLDRVDTVANALLVQAPEEAAAQFVSIPGVKRVLPVRKLHMVLDRAVILDKVAEAWNQVGRDQAGAGVKIAIIDSGIEAGHPGFQDSTLVTPDSFPRTNSSSDLAFTNGKIIVARSYVNLLQFRDPDVSARDRVGHGTALAMIAAGVRNAGPLATITGVAPKAYLGNYKVFGTPGYNDDTAEDVVLKAIDDAVADGMDIISLSLGTDLAPRLIDDPSVQAVERATRAGVIVVVAAGNNGPDWNTMSSPATAPSAIAVGAVTSDRTFAASVEVPGLATFVAVPAASAAQRVPITAPVSDVAALDGDGLACSALPADSLANRVALILRGTCTFETKLLNARAAGAVAAVVYAAQDAPDPIGMAVGAATLPAEMISYDDGVAIQRALGGQPSPVVTLRFTLEAVPIAANRLTDFSAAGPNVDASVKPDLTAVGTDVYTATETVDPRGDMYDASGYVSVDGTSFSTPLVAGAAALLKSARPGLSADQYRSLLINTAATVQLRSGQSPSVQQAGAGLLDAGAALRSTVTAYPASLSFGAGGPDPRMTRTLTLTNVGTSGETFWVAASSTGDRPAPRPAAGSVQLDAGAAVDVPVAWSVSGLAPGTYEGFLTVTGAASGTEIRIPYWYAVTPGAAAHITILDSLASGRSGSAQPDAILFRITDASGVSLADVQPEVTVLSGGGAVRGVASHDSEIPGLFGVTVRLGPVSGLNVFRIQAGAAVSEVAIFGR